MPELAAGLDRRRFLVTKLSTRFALAVLPVSAQTITTDTEGLEAGEVSIPTADIQQVMKDIEEFEALFLCSEKNCNRLVSLEFADKAGKKVKCRCGKKEIQWQFA